jgi:hypothetical protein
VLSPQAICFENPVPQAGKTLLRRKVACPNAWGPQPHAMSLTYAAFFVIGTACSTVFCANGLQRRVEFMNYPGLERRQTQRL